MLRWLMMVVLVGCVPRLGLRSGPLGISCESDAECPGDRPRCIASFCYGEGVVPDLEPPRLLLVSAVDATHVVATFSEPVENVEIVITPGLTVVEVVASNDDQTFTLTTSLQTPAAEYLLRAFRVVDKNGNAIAPDADFGVFSGFGTAVDRTVPDLLAPLDRHFSADLTETFSWSARAGASTYTLEIDEDAGFLPPITLSETVTVTSVMATLPEARRYYWRVRTDISDPFPADYAPRVVDGLSDTIYVHCPADRTCVDGAHLADKRPDPEC